MRISYKDRLTTRVQYRDAKLGDVFMFDEMVCLRVYGNRAVNLETGKFVDIGWSDHIRALDAEVVIA